jgi:tripartite-type tricarboxylate transporter receptor subunit TctC
MRRWHCATRCRWRTSTEIQVETYEAAFEAMGAVGAGSDGRSDAQRWAPATRETGRPQPALHHSDGAAAGKRPGALNYASGGQGTTSHLPAEMFVHQAGVKITHVPYKGVAPAVPDVVANRVVFMMATPTSVAGLVQSGQLRVLAITSEVRSPRYPDVPTFKELGYGGVSFEIWVGMLAPAGLPKAVRARLGQAMQAARSEPQLALKLEELGQSISDVRTPDQFDVFLRAEEAKYAKVIRDANIVAE